MGVHGFLTITSSDPLHVQNYHPSPDDLKLQIIFCCQALVLFQRAGGFVCDLVLHRENATQDQGHLLLPSPVPT